MQGFHSSFDDNHAQHWTLKRGLCPDQLFQPPAGPASEISSAVIGDDFSDRLLVSTSSPLAQQDLVVQTQNGVMISVIGCWSVRQTQNGVNMASGTATTAPSTATTAPSTAPLPLTAGPSTTEPIVHIVAPLGAQGTPSVIQRARPVVSTEQTMQSTAVYGTLPYVSGLPFTAPLPSTAPTLPCLLCQQGLLTQWVIMVRAISSLLCLTPIGCL